MEQDPKILGNTVQVEFIQFHKEVESKVDTGATTSSLHALNIEIDEHNNKVTFSCPELSNELITMYLTGKQEVVSADAGGNTRPTVAFDITINGRILKEMVFNLNDRSEMDSPVLIGQNILKAGSFVVDVSQEEKSVTTEETETRIMEALGVLIDNNLSLKDFVMYLKTHALNDID